MLGLAACSVTLVLLGLMPLRTETMIALTAVAFLSQVGANFVVIPVGGFIAHTVPEDTILLNLTQVTADSVRAVVRQALSDAGPPWN